MYSGTVKVLALILHWYWIKKQNVTHRYKTADRFISCLIFEMLLFCASLSHHSRQVNSCILFVRSAQVLTEAVYVWHYLLWPSSFSIRVGCGLNTSSISLAPPSITESPPPFSAALSMSKPLSSLVLVRLMLGPASWGKMFKNSISMMGKKKTPGGEAHLWTQSHP